MTPPTSSASRAVPTQQSSSPAPTVKGTTYIPLPIPALPAAAPSPIAAVLLISLILLLSIGARFLWRLPQTMRHKPWVQTLGGPTTVQNRALHMLGYIAFVAGLLMGNFTNGVIAAALLMIAANTRPDEDA